jgi:hypothetical protein
MLAQRYSGASVDCRPSRRRPRSIGADASDPQSSLGGRSDFRRGELEIGWPEVEDPLCVREEAANRAIVIELGRFVHGHAAAARVVPIVGRATLRLAGLRLTCSLVMMAIAQERVPAGPEQRNAAK